MNTVQLITNNYLVPASGQTHSVQLNGVFSAAPFVQDWTQFKVDNFAFIPQGVFIDNTQGTAPLVINIQPLNYSISCPAGTSGQYQFPATANQQWSITGNGQASVFAVDFPVFPGGQASNIGNTVNVNVASASNNASPVYTMPPNSPGGLPYYVQKTVLPLTSEYLSTTGAVVTVVPGALNLRKMKLTVSGNATLAAAGLTLITVALNGVNIYKQSVYVPAASAGIASVFDVAFDDAAPAAGAGTLSLSAGTALTAGLIELNAWFD